MPGPMRKRDDERRRRNKDGIETIKVDLEESIGGEVEIPAPPYRTHDRDGNELDEPVPLWHRMAEDWYLSLSRSGQAIFMEPSDWATAYVMAESLSRELSPKPIKVELGDGAAEIQWIVQPVNGAVMNAFLKASASLMTTEGERRRLRIELDRKARADAVAGGDDKVVDIVKRRQDAFG